MHRPCKAHGHRLCPLCTNQKQGLPLPVSCKICGTSTLHFSKKCLGCRSAAAMTDHTDPRKG